jgi:integrase
VYRRPIGKFQEGGLSRVLNEAGVLRGFDGKKRPLLSQATYATIRISEGVSVFKLAADMGTSLEMIESFFSTARSECATLR